MDKALKQRLVGASVLILLAVIVLPMLLSGQPTSQQANRTIEVPPKPAELSFETRRFPVGGQDGSSPSVVKPPAREGTPVVASESGETAAGPESPGGRDEASPDQARSPGQVEQRAAPAVVAAEPGRYLVQVASFSTTANANRLAARLRDDGMPVLMDNVETAAGRLHRVRIGPFDQAADANAAVAELRSRIPDLKPRVLDLRPDESAPVTEPSDPLVRWVVQAGSFSAADNAESLVGRLQTAGFTAYTATVTGARGTSYKVHIGPVIERQSAVELAARLREELQIEGLVVSVD
jgi:cell division septation protein DedD